MPTTNDPTEEFGFPLVQSLSAQRVVEALRSRKGEGRHHMTKKLSKFVSLSLAFSLTIFMLTLPVKAEVLANTLNL
jgi:hypothetical protein